MDIEIDSIDNSFNKRGLMQAIQENQNRGHSQSTLSRSKAKSGRSLKTVKTVHSSTLHQKREACQYMIQKAIRGRQNTDGVDLETKFVSKCGRYRYHVSIIDYLQKYTCSKSIERGFKIMFKRAKPYEVSSINPSDYQKRFVDFMRSTVFNKDVGKMN